MLRKVMIAAMAVAALGACQREQAPTEEPAQTTETQRAITDPAAVVRQSYEPYLTQGAQVPGLQEAAPWSDRMAADIAAMYARTQQGDAPVLDFDPIIDAQDYQLSDVTTATESLAEASHAVVRASFTNMGARHEVVYDLVWEGDRWKVDNVRTAAWDMRAIVTRPS